MSPMKATLKNPGESSALSNVINSISSWAFLCRSDSWERVKITLPS